MICVEAVADQIGVELGTLQRLKQLNDMPSIFEGSISHDHWKQLEGNQSDKIQQKPSPCSVVCHWALEASDLTSVAKLSSELSEFLYVLIGRHGWNIPKGKQKQSNFLETHRSYRSKTIQNPKAEGSPSGKRSENFTTASLRVLDNYGGPGPTQKQTHNGITRPCHVMSTHSVPKCRQVVKYDLSQSYFPFITWLSECPETKRISDQLRLESRHESVLPGCGLQRASSTTTRLRWWNLRLAKLRPRLQDMTQEMQPWKAMRGQNHRLWATSWVHNSGPRGVLLT